MISVTKPYLPSRERLKEYIDGIYERGWLTNNGPLVQELTARLEDYLGVNNLLLVANGTLALQVAYRALGISGYAAGQRVEAVTTPFSFVATTSSLKWEGISPVFVDIDPDTWCINPANIEAAITPYTKAVVPVHVFGNACEVEAIDNIAKQHGLKIIYDGAHAFGVQYKNESLLKYGDATTLSFHATKLFHTIEGGAIVFRKKEDFERAKSIINFGFSTPECVETVGINAKLNEFQAAMGLCVLDEIKENLDGRESIWHAYTSALRGMVTMQKRHPQVSNNYCYFPILLEDESKLKKIVEKLEIHNVNARRYFYPPLDEIDVFSTVRSNENKNSDTVSYAILCLPLYYGLHCDNVQDIAKVISTV